VSKGTYETEETQVNKATKGYHKLLVWQRASELVTIISLYTENFPKVEEFGLKGQIRRAAVSVVLNIAEGYRRGTTKDYLHFLNTADGSLAELEAALEICLNLKLLTTESYENMEKKRSEVGFLLYRLIKSLKEK